MSLISAHEALTAELADSLRQLGSLRASMKLAEMNCWEANRGAGITERRELVRYFMTDQRAEEAQLEMQCEAIRAEIACVEFKGRMGMGAD